MLIIASRAREVAESEDLRQELRRGLVDVLSLEDGPWSERVDPENLVLKGPLESYTFSLQAFLDGEPEAGMASSLLFLAGRGRDDADWGEPGGVSVVPVAAVEVDVDRGPRFAGAAHAAVEGEADRLGLLVDRILRREGVPESPQPYTLTMLQVPEAYLILAVIREEWGDGPPLDDDLPVYKLDLGRPSDALGAIQKTLLGFVREEVRELVGWLEERGLGGEE